MIVKKIRQKRIGVLIIFDDFESKVLNKDVFNKSGLFVGAELSKDELNQLLRLSSKIDVRTKAYQLLSRRSHSVSELRMKLLKKQFDEDIITDTLKSLVDNQYLDDRKFAFLFADEKIGEKKYSVNKVKAELFKRGISKSIINDISDKYQDDEIILKNIKNLSDKKILFLQHKYSDEQIIKQKVFEYLFRKGFEAEKIRMILN